MTSHRAWCIPPRPRSRFWRPAQLGLLVAAFGAPLRGQAPEDRIDIEAFRDSLARSQDSLAMLRLEQQLIEVAKRNRDDARLHLRLGFVSVRIGELGGQGHYDDAASEFQWATELQPLWPYGWYGLGLAENGVGDSKVSLVAGLQTMFGKDHLTRAAKAYAKSVEVDPSFVRGLVELANTALQQRVNIKIDLAREALRQAALTSAGANPEVLLYRGRVEREVGDPDSALTAFWQYLDKGGRRGIGLLEAARTSFVLGRLDGQAPYYEGAAIDDSETVAAYRSDLAAVTNDSALAEFDASRGQFRVAFLQRFWGQRDHADLRSGGERLREHYRRVYYARRNFMLVAMNRHYDITERYRSRSQDFDDRGIIYIRHGEPDQRASYASPDPLLHLNESWRYSRADGELVFHFVALEDVQDYKLVESLFDALGFSAAVRLRNPQAPLPVKAAADQLSISREQLAPIYSRLAVSGTSSAGAQGYMTEERALGARSIAIGTRTDSYELRFNKPLPLKAIVVAAGRDSTRPLLQVAYAIPGYALEPIPTSRGPVYQVRLRVSVADRLGHFVASLDTTRLFLSKDPVPAGENLVGRVALPVTAGRLSYRVALQANEEQGTVLPRDSIEVGDFSGRSFAMSDLIIGNRTTHLIWQPAPEDTAWFNPLRIYRQDSGMELYYEVYGLAEGTTFRTQVAVTKKGGGSFLGLFGGRKPAISLTFDDLSQGSTTRTRRTIGLERLSGGEYFITVTVTTADGRKEVRRQRFELREENKH
jgi:GWxTD domain-containing protein